MSVPLLPNPGPLYPIPDWTPIAESGGSDATVDLDVCQCGCCIYEPDNGKN